MLCKTITPELHSDPGSSAGNTGRSYRFLGKVPAVEMGPKDLATILSSAVHIQLQLLHWRNYLLSSPTVLYT